MTVWEYQCVAVCGSCMATPRLLRLLLLVLSCTPGVTPTCKDGNSCSFLASQGECEAYPVEMLLTCPKACRNPCVCDVSAVSSDTACDCLVKAKKGYCNKTESMIDCQTTCAQVTHESCTPLPLPVDRNASLSTWTNHYLAIVTEVCNRGYSPLVATDQGMKTCAKGGVWVVDSSFGNPVVCEPLDCGNPPSSLNALIDVIETTYGHTAVYYCVKGYIPELGQKTLTCNASGLWEGQPLTCRKVNCGHPPSSPNATYTTSSTTLGGIATYTCTTGFTFVSGSLVLTCNLAEIWQGSLIVCEVIDCKSPPSIPNTQVQINGTFYNQSANYSCLPGFENDQGQNILVCGLSGNWIGNPLKCKTKKTQKPTDSSSSKDLVIAWALGVAIFITFVVTFIIWAFYAGTRRSSKQRSKTGTNTIPPFNIQVWNNFIPPFNIQVWNNFIPPFNIQVWNNFKGNFKTKIEKQAPETKTEKLDNSCANLPVSNQATDADGFISLTSSRNIKPTPNQATDADGFISLTSSRNIKPTHMTAASTHMTAASTLMTAASTHMTAASTLMTAPSSHLLPISNLLKTPSMVLKPESPSSVTLSSFYYSTTPESLPEVAK